MKTAKEYAEEFSRIWKEDLQTEETMGGLESHLKDEMKEYFSSDNPHSAVLELCDIIIISMRMILKFGYDPDEIIADKAIVVQKRMDLARKIYNQTELTISGVQSYKLAKHILEGGSDETNA